MLCIIVIVLILGPSHLTCAEWNSSTSTSGAVKIEENPTLTVKGEKLYTKTSNIISTTPSLLAKALKSDVPLSVLPNKSDHISSINITNIVKLPDKSPLENEQLSHISKKTSMVVTEGGNNVSTLGVSGTNFQDVHENSRDTIVAEGGVQESAGERILPNTTVVSVRPDLDPHSAVIEGISSMNEGKISARKGVFLDNNTVDDNEEHKTGEIDTNSTVTSGDLPHIKKPKPVVTNDSNELLGDKIQNMYYVIPIVCTVFSVPLLVVLAIYLYKRGSDLWERRHYNRMDFLIEGMYNE